MIAVLIWWLLVTLMGWTVLPAALRLFNRLPGRGYALSKALGLLLVSYVFWLLGSFKLLPNSVGGILVAWAVVLALSLIYYQRGGGSLDSLREFVGERWRYIVQLNLTAERRYRKPYPALVDLPAWTRRKVGRR